MQSDYLHGVQLVNAQLAPLLLGPKFLDIQGITK